MGLLEKIVYYSGCSFISDLKDDEEWVWVHAINKILLKDGLEKYSLTEWNDALTYLKRKKIEYEAYDDIFQEVRINIDGN